MNEKSQVRGTRPYFPAPILTDIDVHYFLNIVCTCIRVKSSLTQQVFQRWVPPLFLRSAN